MPEISVVVPVYRVELYLRRCVDSILKQTYGDLELILVDDGSPDRCGEICDAYAREDARVHVLHQRNGGLSAARNAGIDWAFAHSDSRWITFVDSDDWVHPDLLRRLRRAALDSGTRVSVCGFERTTGADPVVRPGLKAELYSTEAFYVTHFVNATIACGKLYEKSCFETIRYPVGRLHEDEFVTYRILFGQPRVVFVPAPLYAYYVNPQGITEQAWSPRRLDAWVAYEEQIAFFRQMGRMDLVRFRYRGYFENALVNREAAKNAPDSPEVLRARKVIDRRLRQLIRRMWRCGAIEFWPDYEELERYHPIRAKLQRFWLEHRK